MILENDVKAFISETSYIRISAAPPSRTCITLGGTFIIFTLETSAQRAFLCVTRQPSLMIKMFLDIYISGLLQPYIIQGQDHANADLMILIFFCFRFAIN